MFVLVGFANRSSDFIIIKRDDPLERFNTIDGATATKFHSYLCVTQSRVTQSGKCWETRGLNRSAQLLIAKNEYTCATRDFTAYLNNWTPIEALNG